MSMEIYTNGAIELDGRNTGLHVRQKPEGTVVYRAHSTDFVPLPAKRYSLATDSPDSGRPGRADFERDLRNAIKASREA